MKDSRNQELKSLFYDLAFYALSQCEPNELDSYEKIFRLDNAWRYLAKGGSYLIDIQRLIIQTDGYSQEIVAQFKSLVKWLYSHEKEATWVIRLALKEVRECQRLARQQLEFSCDTHVS